MATMKYPNVPGGTNMAVSGNGSHVDEVEALFTSACWQNSNINLQNDFIDTHSLTLDGSINNLSADKLLLNSPISQDESEIETDTLDKLFLSSQPTNTSLAELKPLPPFTGYTANLSINGIQGHHYHTISQRIPKDNNNTIQYNNYNEQNIVSSSTCNVSADSAGDCGGGGGGGGGGSGGKTMYSVDEVVKLGYTDCANPDSVSSAKIYEDCSHQTAADSVTHIKTEMDEYDISIDFANNFANIIGCSAIIADTTVPNNNPDSEDPAASKESWIDFAALMDGVECVDQQKSLMTQEGLSEFVVPCTNSEFSKSQQQQSLEYSSKLQPQQGGSTLQNLLTHSYMPLLQNRLQNGPPVKQEAPSSTNYGAELISTSSPPANVVSTTDNLLLTVNGRFMPQYSVHGLADNHRIRSPDLLGQNYPHTTTTTPNAPKKSRSRAQKKQQQQQQQAASSTVYQTEQNLGLLGKEKPVHRCSICNRGFLNKSNIKVHLRTHTGEKPFRCDTCAKAFRQKAHLLKHQQIHKRIGRD